MHAQSLVRFAQLLALLVQTPSAVRVTPEVTAERAQNVDLGGVVVSTVKSPRIKVRDAGMSRSSGTTQKVVNSRASGAACTKV